MAQAAKNQEPSMEEILASIRRIIAEDDPEKPAQHSAEPAGLEPNHPLLASAQTQPESQAASAGALGGGTISAVAGAIELRHVTSELSARNWRRSRPP